MKNCENCKNEIEDNLICSICDYPLAGTKKEQAKFVADQIIKKSDVEEAIEKLKKSRLILFIVGGFYILFPFVRFFINPIFDLASLLEIAIGVFFVIFGLLSFKAPKIALLVPLTLITLYYLLLLVVSPIHLVQGSIWKVIVFSGLTYGLLSVIKADKILKKNPYLASILGFGKIRNL